MASTTHWSFWNLVNYSIDGVIDFSDKPLAMASFLGIISFIIAIGALIFIVGRAWLFGDPTGDLLYRRDVRFLKLDIAI